MILTVASTLTTIGLLGLIYIYTPYKITKVVVSDINKMKTKTYTVEKFMNK